MIEEDGNPGVPKDVKTKKYYGERQGHRHVAETLRRGYTRHAPISIHLRSQHLWISYTVSSRAESGGEFTPCAGPARSNRLPANMPREVVQEDRPRSPVWVLLP